MNIKNRSSRGGVFLLTAFVLSAFAIGGCSTAQRTAPHLFFDADVGVRAALDRDDLIIMDSVEGSSSTTSILAGIIQVIDGDRFKFLWIPFFKEKYTYFSDSSLPVRFVSTEDRAYYKALEKVPNADAVLAKSMEREQWGFPLLFETRSVTWRGKALSPKTDR